MHGNEYRKIGTSNFVVHFELVFAQLFNTIFFVWSHVGLLSNTHTHTHTHITQYKLHRSVIPFVRCVVRLLKCGAGEG